VSDGMSRCEIAASWSDQRNDFGGPISVWRPRRAAPAPVLPQGGPRTHEEMVAAHKARQARIWAAGESEKARMRAISDRAHEVRELNEKAKLEAIEACRAKWKRADEERARANRSEKERRELRAAAVTYPSIRKIIVAVAQDYGIAPIDMMSHRRTYDVVLPRQVAMYIAKTTTLRSLPDIGRQFGGKDHTTVLSAVRKIARLIAVDPELASKVEALRASVAPQTDEAAGGS
jgi:chromosomal replication initiation ATPase DnaA